MGTFTATINGVANLGEPYWPDLLPEYEGIYYDFHLITGDTVGIDYTTTDTHEDYECRLLGHDRSCFVVRIEAAVAADLNYIMTPGPIVQSRAYTFPCWVETWSHVAYGCWARIQTTDGLKWVTLSYNTASGLTTFACSNSAENFSVDIGSSSANDDGLMKLEVLSDGTVRVTPRVIYGASYTTCTPYYRNVSTWFPFDTSVPIFAAGDELLLGSEHFRSAVDASTGYQKYLAYEVTFKTETDNVALLETIIESDDNRPDSDFGTTQDNDTGRGAFYVEFLHSPSHANYNEWVDWHILDYERSPDLEWTSYSAMTRLSSIKRDSCFGMMYKNAIESTDFFENTTYGFTIAWALSNADRSRFLVFFVIDIDYAYDYLCVLDSSFNPDDPALIIHQGTVDFTSTSGLLATLRTEPNGEIFFSVDRVGYEYYDEVTLQKADYFSPTEPLYLWSCMHPDYWLEGPSTSVGSISWTGYQWLLSDHIAHRVDIGQTPNATLRGGDYFHVALTDKIEKEHVCYFKNKISNTQDPTDLSAMLNMNPNYPSDDAIPLKENDACMVHEKYNRFYFYQVRPGDVLDNAPDVYRIDDNRYWQLVDYVSQPTFLVEQYDVVGLVDTNDVIITHTAHNRADGSYAPCVQLQHNNKWRTHGIQVSVISNTQLRLTTAETTVITDLKINLYITPIV